MRWTPHATVAAVVERDGAFLLVEETKAGRRVLNQPAGHLEDGESLLEAVVRETLEETAWTFRPRGLVGIYRWRHPGSGETFLRTCFYGDAVQHHPERALDVGIDAAVWLTPDAIRAQAERLRSPLVLRTLEDYLSGGRFPLDVLKDLG
jgi:8-oxo-dGTP pyrophosphatase MutT (NUDIX family)